MPAPATRDDFLDLLRKTDVVDPDVLDAYLDQFRAAGPLPAEPKTLAGLLVRDGVLTHFQAGLFLLGRTTGFTVETVTTDRIRKGGLGLAWALPVVHLWTRAAMRKESDERQRAANAEIARHMLSPDLLFGRTLMLVARKPA